MDDSVADPSVDSNLDKCIVVTFLLGSGTPREDLIGS